MVEPACSEGAGFVAPCCVRLRQIPVQPDSAIGPACPQYVSRTCCSFRKTAMADDAKTPSQLADEARQTARDASTAVSGIADEGKAIAQDAAHALRSSAQNAKATAGEALDTVRGVAADARDVAADAADAGKAYARSAVDEVGKKAARFKDRSAGWQEACVKQIAAEPVKSMLVAAAGGALFAGLLLAFDRSGRRYCD